VSGTWHTLYLDGVQVAQNLSGGNIFASYQTITNTVIGAQTTLAQAFQGTIGDVRVYNYAIPQRLVSSLYRDRNLVVYYPFDTSVNSLTPNYASLVYDASLIGQPSITASADANVGSGALSLTNSATTVATQYVKTTPGIVGQVGWNLNAAAGVTIACWINVAGVANRIQRIFDIPLSVNQKGLAIDISGTNMLYTGWYPVAPLGPIDLLSATAKSAMLGTGKSAGAFGTQLLYSGYKGPVMQIKNGSGGTPTDFYADPSGNLGTAYLGTGTPLATFLAGAVAYVTTWYDQTGNGNHATQGTAAPVYNQTLKCLDFGSGTTTGQSVGANAYFTLQNGAYPSGNSNFTYVVKHGILDTNNFGGGAGFIFGGGWTTSESAENLICDVAGGNYYRDSTIGTNFQTNANTLKNNQIISLMYNGSYRYFYINSVNTNSFNKISRNQAASLNTIGAWNNNGTIFPNYYLNSQLYYFYYIPSDISTSDRNILESTGITPFAYYPFDIAANSLSPNIASGTPVYDFSLNSFSGATIAVPPSSYPFLGSGCLSIPNQSGSQAQQTSLAYYDIVRIPTNTSVSYTFSQWFNLSTIKNIIFNTQSSLTTSAEDAGSSIGLWLPSSTQIYTGVRIPGTQVVYNNGGLTLNNGFPNFYNVSPSSPTGWCFLAVTLTTTGSTTALLNIKIISANNTNITNNISKTTNLTFSSTIIAPKVFYLGSPANYTGYASLGYYDNFQFYSTPLTQAQILNLYYNNSASLTTTNNYSVNITYNFVNIGATASTITADAVMNVFTGANAAFVASIGTSPTLSGSAISVTNGGIYTTASANQTFSSGPSIQTFSATTNFCMGAALPSTNNVDIFNFGGTPNTSTSYRFYITTTGALTAAAGTGYTSPVVFATLAVNTWYHIAVSFTTTGFTLYLNGVAQTPTSGSAAVTGIFGFTYVGLGYSASTNTTYYNYWKYFGYTLSASDVSTIYASDFYKAPVQVVSDYAVYYPLTGSSAITSTQLYNGVSKAYDGTLVNSPVMSSANYIISPSSLYFPSTASCTLPSFSNTSTQFSISIWFNTTSVGNDPTLFLAVNGNDIIQIFIQNASSMLTLLLTNGTYGSGSNSNTNIVSITVNTWYHLAWIVDGTNWSVYLNNTLYTYSSKSSPSIISHTTTFGNPGGGGAHSGNGYIQDFRIYNRLLTAAEVTSIYTYRGGGG